ncbi:MAG: DUF2188 domain-containing protein [Tahibacter sp.]
MLRSTYHVVYKAEDRTWHVEEEGGRSLAQFDTKDRAVREAQLRASAHELNGTLARLFVHRENGMVQMEYSYGAEPRRVPG